MGHKDDGVEALKLTRWLGAWYTRAELVGLVLGLVGMFATWVVHLLAPDLFEVSVEHGLVVTCPDCARVDRDVETVRVMLREAERYPVERRSQVCGRCVASRESHARLMEEIRRQRGDRPNPLDVEQPGTGGSGSGTGLGRPTERDVVQPGTGATVGSGNPGGVGYPYNWIYWGYVVFGSVALLSFLNARVEPQVTMRQHQVEAAIGRHPPAPTVPAPALSSFCGHCGQPRRPNRAFCEGCGGRLD